MNNIGILIVTMQEFTVGMQLANNIDLIRQE